MNGNSTFVTNKVNSLWTLVPAFFSVVTKWNLKYKAHYYRQNIFDYDPNCKASKSYTEFTKELISLC